jgi:hypothetical protein
MRRALGLALLTAALVPLTARAQAITAAPGGEMTSLVGMPFDVPFYLDMTARTEKLGAFAARVQWNPAVLRLDGGSNGSFGSTTINEDSLAVGVARLAGANPAGVGGLITLGVLHFTPLVAQPDTIHLAVAQVFAAGSFADLSSSLTTRNGYFCPARGMFGDMDKDGSINSRDALIALSNAVGLDVSAFDITVGDVDANGATNARDALIILSSAVGLPVTSFRVGRLAGGACSANLPLVMAIVPNIVDVAVGQTVAFEARAADSSGTLQTVTDAIWRSGNSAALVVLGDGTAQARDTGTVRVTAVRTALDSAQAVVHIVAHRTRHIVDATAASARNQLGTAAFPFSSIGQGLGFAQDGDTVEVRPGRYDEAFSLNNAAVLMGDTLPDGTRPLVAGTSDYTGIQLQGTGDREVHNLALDGFGTGVDVYGPSRVLLRGLLATHTRYGVIVETPLTSLRIEKSRFTGNGTNAGGNGVEIDALVHTLVLQETEISDFGYDGVLAGGVDSLAVLRSQIHDVGDYGIEASPDPNYCGQECAPPVRPSRANDMAPPSTAVAVDSSSIVRAGYRVAYLDGVRSAAFSHSRLGGGEYGVQVYGVNGGWVRFLGDSVASYGAPGYYTWLNAYYLDSLTMDSMFVQAPYGYLTSVSLLRVRNSQFTDVTDNPLSGSSVDQVFLDNVTASGDPHCDLCADGFNFGSAAVTANRLTVENMWRGIQANYDSSLTVTHSLFRHVEYPINWSVSSNDTLSRLTVTNTTFSGFGDGIYAFTGAVVLDSNTFMNSGGTAVYVDNERPSRVTRNRIAGVDYGVEIYGATSGQRTDTIADNVITEVPYEGIYASGGDTVQFRILRNGVTCNQVGTSEAYAIELDYASGTVTANQVSGCYSGIDVYDDGSSARSDTIAGNTLSLPANPYDAIYAEGTLRLRIAGNAVTGDTTGALGYGSIAVYGYQPGATAAIDSNVVTGGTTSGIYVAYLDTALVRFNTVRGVKAPSTYQGAINLNGGLDNLALIHGNQVRRTYGNGIRILNSGFVPDTAMIRVDSNLVDSSTADGIRLDGGSDSITRNRITHNAIGVEFASYSVDENRSLVSGNNIVGNLFGVLQGLDAYYQAPNNWWGDVNGPRCQFSCTASLAGDSVTDGGVNYTPFAAAVIGGTPAPAAGALPIVAVRAPALRAVNATAPMGRDAPLAPKPRPERATRTLSVQAPPALAAAHVPSGLSPARVQAWQQVLQLRTAAVAARLQRDAAEASAQQTRLAAGATRERQLEQRKAERESSRAAIQVKRAARTARHARPQ